MKPILTFLLAVCICYATPAQSTDEDPEPTEFVTLDKEPIPLNLNDIKLMIGYPELAREASITGKVVVRILIDTDGKYLKHIVLKEGHPILLKAVVDQIYKLKFKPAVLDNKPVKCWVSLPFDFKLLDNPSPPMKVVPPSPLNAEAVVAKISKKEIENLPPEQAVVKLKVQVSATGEYISHTIVESPSDGITSAVNKNAKNLQFTVPTFNGEAKACWTTMELKLK